MTLLVRWGSTGTSRSADGIYKYVDTILQPILNCLCQCIGSANNMNKLSLVGMQLPETHKENFDVSSEKGLRLELDEGPFR